MVANISRAYPPHPTTLGMGSIGLNLAFYEHSHVAYQIKGNHEKQQQGGKYFAMAHGPRGRVKRLKYDFFQSMVMLHIKLKGITHAVAW